MDSILVVVERSIRRPFHMPPRPAATFLLNSFRILVVTFLFLIFLELIIILVGPQ